MNSIITIIIAGVLLLITLLLLIILVRQLIRLFRESRRDSAPVLLNCSLPAYGFQASYKPDRHPYFRVLEEYEDRIGNFKSCPEIDIGEHKAKPDNNPAI